MGLQARKARLEAEIAVRQAELKAVNAQLKPKTKAKSGEGK